MGNYLVIGGSAGIGKMLVSQLEGEGHSVIATYNKHQAESRANVRYIKYDVLMDDFDSGMLPQVLHGLAYCPGSINLKPFTRFTESDFLEDYKLQVLGAIKSIRKVLPNLKRSGKASIVLFSTIAVQNGFAFHSQVSASKGAIEGLTRSLAAELAPDVRVNAVAPSLTDTSLAGRLVDSPEKKAAHGEKNPLKRIGEAEDSAQAAAFLLRSTSSWITGQIVHVDGGQSVIR